MFRKKLSTFSTPLNEVPLLTDHACLTAAYRITYEVRFPLVSLAEYWEHIEPLQNKIQYYFSAASLDRSTKLSIDDKQFIKGALQWILELFQNDNAGYISDQRFQLHKYQVQITLERLFLGELECIDEEKEQPATSPLTYPSDSKTFSALVQKTYASFFPDIKLSDCANTAISYAQQDPKGQFILHAQALSNYLIKRITELNNHSVKNPIILARCQKVLRCAQAIIDVIFPPEGNLRKPGENDLRNDSPAITTIIDHTLVILEEVYKPTSGYTAVQAFFTRDLRNQVPLDYFLSPDINLNRLYHHTLCLIYTEDQLLKVTHGWKKSTVRNTIVQNIPAIKQITKNWQNEFAEEKKTEGLTIRT